MSAVDIYPRNLLIAGELRQGAGSEREIYNPASGMVLTTVADASLEDVSEAVAAADSAWPKWAAKTPFQRATVLRQLATLVEQNAERLVMLLVDEVGKPISEAQGEVGATRGYLTYTASLLEALSDSVAYTGTPGEELWIKRRPHGVVGAIIPWNYPSALVTRKLAPAIAAGNAIVLKADEKTPLSALALAQIFADSGLLPSGLVNVLTGKGQEIGAAIVANPSVGFVTMTGSGPAGKAILAATASQVKPVSLELGGNAPFIVLPSADIDRAVNDALLSRHMNCGQVCIATERIYLHESIHEEFTRKYLAQIARLTPADPRLASTKIGPKVSEEERARTERSIELSLQAGATLLAGGDRPTVPGLEGGYWLNPTVLAGVDESTAAVKEELFGPVTPLATFTDWDTLVAQVNASQYGLSAYVYTSQLEEAYRASDEIRYGEVYINRVGSEEINGFHAGFRQSGLGGDDGPLGLDQYFLKQTTYLRHRLG